jgi:membrane protein
MELSVERVKRGLSAFMDDVTDHELPTLAAALAFYAVLSLAPLLLATLSIIGEMGVDVRPTILSAIESQAGPAVAGVIHSILGNLQKYPEPSTAAGILGFLVLLFSASGVYFHLQNALNVIWLNKRKRRPSLWQWGQHRLLAAVMVIVMALVLAVSLMLNAIAAILYPEKAFIWQLLNSVVSMTLFAAIFAVMFKLLPEHRMSWKVALVGGGITSLLFALGRFAFELYVSQSSLASSYGATASFIMLLLWIYYSVFLFLLGAELTRAMTMPLTKRGHAHSH